MAFYKFTDNDFFVNFLDTKPSCKFDIYNSQIFYNNASQISGEFATSVPNIPAGHISLYELNVDRNASTTGLIFPFITKDSSLTTFKTISTSEFYSIDYGTDISSSTYPLSASIVREYFSNNHFRDMKNNNQSVLNKDRSDHGGLNLSLQASSKTSAGFPDFNTSDSALGVDGVTRSSLDRYIRLKTLLSSSHINSLKNVINSKSNMSPHFQYSASISPVHRDLDAAEVNLISIPSIFYGSAIERGTVSLKYYLTGTLIGELSDKNHNGELIQVGPTDAVEGSNEVAGIVLYNEGFIILTGSWDLYLPGGSDDAELDYEPNGVDSSKWLYFGIGANDGTPPDGSHYNSRISASFSLEFSGSSMVPVMTMLAHAPKGQLNYSNNPTYLSHSTSTDYYASVTSSVVYSEPELNVVNIVSSSFDNPTASFAKETYISKVGLYDENKNLIGVTTVAKPVKKTEDREFTFKIKMDI